MNKKEFKQSNARSESEDILDEFLIEKLSEATSLKDANFCLHILEETINRSEKSNIFSKIVNCVKILKNQDKDIVVREAIIDKIANEFYPLLTECSEDLNEEIQNEQIDELANTLGGIIHNHEVEDDFINNCKKAFIETMKLGEKI